jgi:hypothetical protein
MAFQVVGGLVGGRIFWCWRLSHARRFPQPESGLSLPFLSRHGSFNALAMGLKSFSSWSPASGRLAPALMQALH